MHSSRKAFSKPPSDYTSILEATPQDLGQLASSDKWLASSEAIWLTGYFPMLNLCATFWTEFLSKKFIEYKNTNFGQTGLRAMYLSPLKLIQKLESNFISLI